VRPAEAVESRAGAALDASRVDGPGAPVRSTLPSARAGLALRPARPLTVFATVARYVRPPTLAEQFGASPSVIGNAALNEESGGSLDVGARLDVDASPALALGAEAVGFGRLADGLISYERSSAGVLEPFNVGSARVLGAEGALSARLFDVVLLDASLTFLDPRDTSEGRTTTNDLVPFFARFVATPSVAVELHDLVREIRFDFLHVGADLAYRSPRFADPAGLVELPEAVDLGVDAAIGFARGAFTLRGRLTNLLDRRTTDLLGYPLPGRAFHLSIEGTTP
jgi:iron complex outermembrane receptor protein